MSNQAIPGGFASFLISNYDLAPAYRPGDQAIYIPTTDVDPTLNGVEAIVATRDGRQLLRIIRKDVEGKWTLMTPNGQQEHGVQLQSAATIKWVKRGGDPGPTLH